MYPSPENPLKRKHDTVDSTTSLSSAPASSKEEKQHQFRWDLKNVTHKALESGLEADKVRRLREVVAAAANGIGSRSGSESESLY